MTNPFEPHLRHLPFPSDKHASYILNAQSLTTGVQLTANEVCAGRLGLPSSAGKSRAVRSLEGPTPRSANDLSVAPPSFPETRKGGAPSLKVYHIQRSLADLSHSLHSAGSWLGRQRCGQRRSFQPGRDDNDQYLTASQQRCATRTTVRHVGIESRDRLCGS